MFFSKVITVNCLLDLEMSAKILKNCRDKDTEYLIFGYFRINIDDDMIVPSLVYDLCLKFYWISEYFETCHGIKISEDKLQITGKSIFSCFNYCHREIESNKKAIYKWTLYTTNPIIMIGITSYPTSQNVNWYHLEGIIYYGLRSSYRNRIYKPLNDSALEGNDIYIDYGCQDVESAHTIGILLDLENKQLSFEINGKHRGIAFENIYCNDDIYYTLSMKIYQDTIVTLVSFEHNLW